MKSILNLFKKWTALACVFSLLNMPLAITAEKEHSNNQEWVNVATGVFDQVKQTMAQGYAARANTQRALQMRQQLQGFLGQPQVTRAKFFEHCVLPAAISEFPENACQDISHPSELNVAKQFLAIAQARVKMYDITLTPAQNTRTPKAIQCIMDAQKKLNQQMNKTIQDLEAEETKIRQLNEQIAAQQEKLADELRAEAGFLNGGSADIHDLFKDTTCENVINETDFQGGQGSKGLQGVFHKLTRPQSGSASSLNQLSGRVKNQIRKVKKDVKKQKDKIESDIKRLGIVGWSSLKDRRFTRLSKNGKVVSPNLIQSVDEEVENFVSENQIQLQYLRSLGINVNTGSKDYARDLNNFNKKSIQKTIISDCVLRTNDSNMGFDSNGKGLPIEQILSKLEQRGSRSKGSLTTYLTKVRSILSTGKPIEDIIAQLKNEDRSKSITYRDRDPDTGRLTDMTLSESLSRSIFKCHQVTKFDQTFVDSSTGKRSQTIYNQRTKDAEKAIAKLKNQEANFINKIKENIDDQILTCKSKELAPGDCSNPGQMTASSPNFCARTANICSTQVNSCVKHTKQVIDTKVSSIRQKVKTYNTRMQNLYNNQNRSLKAVTNRFLGGEGNFFKAYFTGADFQLPKKLFVPLPKPQGTPGLLGSFENNQPLRILGGLPQNGVIPPFYEHFPKQIEKVKVAYQKLLDGGPRSINTQINEYIKTQEIAAKTNRAKWAGLEAQCKGALGTFKEQIARDNAKKTKDYNKLVSKVKQFCYKYSGLARSNPAAGCGEGSGGSSPQGLYQEAAEISAHLDRSVGTAINAYNNLCARAQNNSEAEGDDVPKIADLCDGGSFEGGIEEYKDRLTERLPADLEDDLDEYVGGGEMSEELRASPYKNLVRAYKNLKNAGEGKTNNYQERFDKLRDGYKPDATPTQQLAAVDAVLDEFKEDPKIKAALAKDTVAGVQRELGKIKLAESRVTRSPASSTLGADANAFFDKVKAGNASIDSAMQTRIIDKINETAEAWDNKPETLKAILSNPAHTNHTAFKAAVLAQYTTEKSTIDKANDEHNRRVAAIDEALKKLDTKTGTDKDKYERLSNHSPNFKSGSGLCTIMENEKKFEAVKSCTGNSDFSTCVSDKVNNPDELSSTAASLNGSLTKLSSMDKSDVADEWASIGRRMGPCEAQTAQQRKPTGEFDLGNSQFQDGFNGATRNFGGMNNDFFFK